MAHFTYQALDAAGAAVSGDMEAPTRGEAYRQLEARRLSPLELKESAAVEAVPAEGAGMPRMNRNKLIFFTGELADLLDAGLPAQQALTVMAEKQQDPIIRKASALARMHLREGQTLAASFRMTSPAFDDFYTSLVSAGEASGTLSGVLHRMAQSMTQLQ
ncbi:MAG: secretion system protein, partial [Verrucomicrobiales bacterium]|nr:secretion system protein [Verrucomicrobiales bacterium]